MASFLGSLLGGVSKGVEAQTRYNMAEESRGKERNWQSQQEERRAARAEALAKWQDGRADERLDKQLTAQADQLDKQLAAQAEREESRNNSLIESARIEAENKSAEREGDQMQTDVDYVRRRTDELDDMIPQARIKAATESIGGGVSDVTSVLDEQELNALDDKLKLYTSLPEETIKRAGKWNDFMAVKALFDTIAAREAERQAPAKTSLDSVEITNPDGWETPSGQNAQEFLNSISNPASASIMTNQERDDLLNSFGG